MNSDLINIIKKYTKKMTPLKTDIKPSIFRLESVKAVIFDIYGTLFISEAGDISHSLSKTKRSSFFRTFRESGLDPASLKPDLLENIESVYLDEIRKEHKRLKEKGIKYPEVVITKIWRNIINQLTDKNVSAADINKIAVIYESVSNRICPMPGAKEIINYLKNKGIITGLISNAQFYTPLMFDASFGKNITELGFDPDLSIFSYIHKRGKPDSFLFTKAADILKEKYNIKPHEVLYTGNDMLNDILAADSAGMKTALFAGDKRSLRLREDNPECRMLTPDLIITDLHQIYDII